MVPVGRWHCVVSSFLLTLTVVLACQKGPEASRGVPAQTSKSSTPIQSPKSATSAPPPTASAAAAATASPVPAPSDAPPAQPLGKIYLQQFGAPLSAADLEFTLRSLAYFFANEVVVLPTKDLPAEAYYPPRGRYRAEKILDRMASETPEDAQVMVGLTTVDISTTKGEYEDWGILGLATVSGRECVISRFRAARGAKNDLHTRQRLAKVVVHEIGHTLGLPHCPEYGCLMEDGKGSVLTTDHELDFCPSCRKAVAARILTQSGPLPWDPAAHLEALPAP
jgi:archaemetzincin